jgi:hypothetical protein
MDTSVLLDNYGLAGFVIVALAGVVVVLYRDNKALQEKLRDSQQARVDDQKEFKTDIANTLEVQGKVQDLIYRKLYDAKRDA